MERWAYPPSSNETMTPSSFVIVTKTSSIARLAEAYSSKVAVNRRSIIGKELVSLLRLLDLDQSRPTGCPPRMSSKKFYHMPHLR
jgi:hypothetical protein